MVRDRPGVLVGAKRHCLRPNKAEKFKIKHRRAIGLVGMCVSHVESADIINVDRNPETRRMPALASPSGVMD